MKKKKSYSLAFTAYNGGGNTNFYDRKQSIVLDTKDYNNLSISNINIYKPRGDVSCTINIYDSQLNTIILAKELVPYVSSTSGGTYTPIIGDIDIAAYDSIRISLDFHDWCGSSCTATLGKITVSE